MPRQFRILIVDDEEIRDVAAETLATLEDCECLTESNPLRACERVLEGGIHLVLTDLHMPELTGEGVLERVRAFNPEIPVLVMTGYATLESAVALFRKGAFDYITKPFAIHELRQRVQNALEPLRLKEQIRELRGLASAAALSGEIVARAPAMEPLLRQLPAAARSGAPILILGETGTGKELVARAVHRLSPRASGAFVAVNCAALPEALLESELFGHIAGAFTDARENRSGVIQAAAGGTLFLDEVGEMTLASQVKLLRFLQEGEIKPVGSTRTVKADVRVVAATNRDLLQQVQAGRFREDLYFRLNVIPLRLPPLRERREDIPALVARFVERFSRDMGSSVKSFSTSAVHKLMSYDWPGNVRELENKVRQILAMAVSEVVAPEEFDLPAVLGVSTPQGALLPFKEAKAQAIAEFERRYAMTALALAHGNISQAARLAGKHKRAFWGLVKDLGLVPRRPGDEVEGEGS